MPNKEGGYAPNYTPTAATDGAAGFIVDCDVIAGPHEHVGGTARGGRENAGEPEGIGDSGGLRAQGLAFASEATLSAYTIPGTRRTPREGNSQNAT